MIDFNRWQQDRQTPGTLAHTIRAVYSHGHSYADAMDLFRTCFLAEAALDCEGNLSLTAAEVRISRWAIGRILNRYGFTVAALRGMPKQTVVGGRKR